MRLAISRKDTNIPRPEAMKTRFIIPVILIGVVFYVISKVLHIQKVKENAKVPDFEILSGDDSYQQQLAAFRNEFRATDMPKCRFFLFGMGNRTKLIYKNGILRNALTEEILKEWQVSGEVLLPNNYMLKLETSQGVVIIYENEDGVFISEGGDVELIPGSGTPLTLPDFAGHPYSEILKVLNHEILVNIVDSKPVPNFFVYNKPWRRDAAMMAMCLEETGNLDLIRDWVLGLDDPYDRNNAGETEADNLGQTLYLISLFTDKSHPLVGEILKEVEKYEVRDEYGFYIKGRSDFHETPVYQTKWLKFGLKSLGLEDNYNIPMVQDNYASLFWWDYKDSYMPGTTDAGEDWKHDRYPYIGWAADHFHGRRRNPISNRDYPLTWETQASQAYYEGMKMVDNIFAEQKTSVPHTWHAAEVFLYLIENL
jgi:hypothetical protein